MRKTKETQKLNLPFWNAVKGREIRDSLTITRVGVKKFDKSLYKFQAQVQPKLNSVFVRYVLNNQVQSNNSIEQFVTRLKVYVKDCNHTNRDERGNLIFFLLKATC